jgi:hypothetical protein
LLSAFSKCERGSSPGSNSGEMEKFFNAEGRTNYQFALFSFVIIKAELIQCFIQNSLVSLTNNLNGGGFISCKLLSTLCDLRGKIKCYFCDEITTEIKTLKNVVSFLVYNCGEILSEFNFNFITFGGAGTLIFAIKSFSAKIFCNTYSVILCKISLQSSIKESK